MITHACRCERLLRSWYLVSSPQISAAAQNTAPAEPGLCLLRTSPLGFLLALQTARGGEAESPDRAWLWVGPPTGCSSSLVDLHWHVAHPAVTVFNKHRQVVRPTGSWSIDRQAVHLCLFTTHQITGESLGADSITNIIQQKKKEIWIYWHFGWLKVEWIISSWHHICGYLKQNSSAPRGNMPHQLKSMF